MTELNPHKNRLANFTAMLPQVASPGGLHREGATFFVGGELPIYQTLETMYESYCLEATRLFYLSFGSIESFRNGEEMARQIKKNFNVRLMARIDFPVTRTLLERIYAAGVDLVEISLPVSGYVEEHHADLSSYLKEAVSVFPKWSVTSTLVAGRESFDKLLENIDSLSATGVVPMVLFTEQAHELSTDEKGAALKHLAANWKKYRVPLEPYLPLLDFMAPMDIRKHSGGLRGILGKIREHHKMMSCDLRRHLRVQQTENSLDSAGL